MPIRGFRGTKITIRVRRIQGLYDLVVQRRLQRGGGCGGTVQVFTQKVQHVLAPSQKSSNSYFIIQNDPTSTFSKVLMLFHAFPLCPSSPCPMLFRDGRLAAQQMLPHEVMEMLINANLSASSSALQLELAWRQVSRPRWDDRDVTTWYDNIRHTNHTTWHNMDCTWTLHGLSMTMSAIECWQLVDSAAQLCTSTAPRHLRRDVAPAADFVPPSSLLLLPPPHLRCATLPLFSHEKLCYKMLQDVTLYVTLYVTCSIS